MAAVVEPVRPPAGVPEPGEVRIVDVPARKMLLIDGCGAPGSPAFQESLQALFSIAWALHFRLSRQRGIDAPVGTLEGLFDLGPTSPDATPTWTLMIRLPDVATTADVDASVRDVRSRRHLAGLDRVRVESFHEGLAAEILHVGPYDAEAGTIARLHDAIAARGYRIHGRHHEIYVGDPRRSAPSRLRTVIRQPIA
jgi:hypothetical protein